MITLTETPEISEDDARRIDAILARVESDDYPDEGTGYAPDDPNMPPDMRLLAAANRRDYYVREGERVMREAVAQVREQNHLSWHKIGLALGITAEGARRRYGANR